VPIVGLTQRELLPRLGPLGDPGHPPAARHRPDRLAENLAIRAKARLATVA
jgi:hypothetical protein